LSWIFRLYRNNKREFSETIKEIEQTRADRDLREKHRNMEKTMKETKKTNKTKSDEKC
jgi:hypothetical protein